MTIPGEGYFKGIKYARIVTVLYSESNSRQNEKYRLPPGLSIAVLAGIRQRNFSTPYSFTPFEKAAYPYRRLISYRYRLWYKATIRVQ